METARGIEYGKVVLAPREVSDDSVVHPLKEVLRVATKMMMKEKLRTEVRKEMLLKSVRRKSESMGWK